jgi:dTDP-glucose 4,6-dehydratase
MSGKRRVLVIGSNSFSGSDFIDLLLEEGGSEVVGLSRGEEKGELFLPYLRHRSPDYRFVQLDLNHDGERLARLVDDFAPQYVINFAAQSEVAPSWRHPEQWFETNAVAVARLGNLLKDRPELLRYVHISSPEVYGSCVGRVTEEAPLNPSTPYAASKAAGDLMLLTLVKQYRFPLVMIRATNVYGAHQQLFKIIPRSVIYLRKGRSIELHGGGVAIKSYIHIRDVSRGELRAMEAGEPGSIYHLSPDQGLAVREVVRLICERTGKAYEAATTAVAERPGQDAAYVIDSSRARRELGWSPSISIEEGLDDVVRWIDDNWTLISKEPLEYVHRP